MIKIHCDICHEDTTAKNRQFCNGAFGSAVLDYCDVCLPFHGEYFAEGQAIIKQEMIVANNRIEKYRQKLLTKILPLKKTGKLAAVK